MAIQILCNTLTKCWLYNWGTNIEDWDTNIEGYTLLYNYLDNSTNGVRCKTCNSILSSKVLQQKELSHNAIMTYVECPICKDVFDASDFHIKNWSYISISAMVWRVFEDDNFQNKNRRHTYNKKSDNLESSYRK